MKEEEFSKSKRSIMVNLKLENERTCASDIISNKSNDNEMDRYRNDMW